MIFPIDLHLRQVCIIFAMAKEAQRCFLFLAPHPSKEDFWSKQACKRGTLNRSPGLFELLSVALLHGRLGLVRKLMRRIWLMGRLEQAGKTGGEKGRVSVFRNI